MNFEELKLRMNCTDPESVSADQAKSVLDKIQNLQESFASKAGSPQEFKKVFKYNSLWEWTNTYCNMVSIMHQIDESNVKMKDLEW